MRRDLMRPVSSRRPAFGRLAVWVALVSVVVAVAAAPASASQMWSITPSPSPAGPPIGQLHGVSCPSTTSCFAVGSQGDAPNLVEHWNGTNWSVITNPNPAGAAFTSLNGVSCPSTTSCYAVGDYGLNTVPVMTYKTLVEHWNGTTWSIVFSPGPSGSDIVELNSVSCPSTTSCDAVGDVHGVSTGSTLVEHFNGTTWSVVTSPNASEFGLNSLDAVSCPNTSNCNAVGFSQTFSTINTLVEHWNGTTWSIVTSPNPSGAIESSLSGVSCPSTSSCTAVGGSFSATDATLVEHWNGTTWSIVASPNPSGATSSSLTAISCANTTNCNAVGASQNGSTGSTFLERWNGTTWSILASPNPSGSTSTLLLGLSCVSTTSCTAVGSYIAAVPSPDGSAALVEQWNGVSWSLAAAPPGSSESQLVQVSCPTTTSCFAVGQSVPGSSAGGNTLVEHWNGTTWSVATSPNPTGATSTELLGVSCPSTTNCNAVGESFMGTTRKTLIEHWNGTAWSIVTSPNPSGGADPALNGVSCPSTTNCTAVGAYIRSDSTTATLVEHWNGTSWSVVPSPNPTSAAGSVLNGVSCASSTSCNAVGSDTRSDSTTVPLAEQWNGTTWSIVTTPNPSGTTVTVLRGVSCVSTTNCYAVGSDQTSTTENTLVEH